VRRTMVALWVASLATGIAAAQTPVTAAAATFAMAEGSTCRAVGVAEPSFAFDTTDFWAQSLTLGFAYRF
jgi:hypothetical protein